MATVSVPCSLLLHKQKVDVAVRIAKSDVDQVDTIPTIGPFPSEKKKAGVAVQDRIERAVHDLNVTTLILKLLFQREIPIRFRNMFSKQLYRIASREVLFLIIMLVIMQFILMLLPNILLWIRVMFFHMNSPLIILYNPIILVLAGQVMLPLIMSRSVR